MKRLVLILALVASLAAADEYRQAGSTLREGHASDVALDIAGAASNGGAPYGVIAKGPTGATVRTLIAMTEDFSRP